MAQDQTKKEALFNEVKGSLFEYLMAKKISEQGHEELRFIESLDKNYLTVLSQQDRMVRQFYPEMLPFLAKMADSSLQALKKHLGPDIHSPRLMGKFINSSIASELNEADLVVETRQGSLPVSLKLNKKNAFVNTKSGGIKSFFTQYFPSVPIETQEQFNRLVDQEFNRMSLELHDLNDMEFAGNYQAWVKAGKSELPGELSDEERKILKSFYARVAKEMHSILSEAFKHHHTSFLESLPALMGFSSKEILQLVCFHDFKMGHDCEVFIHDYAEIASVLSEAKIQTFNQTSSVEVVMGNWTLQIRVKPMNKFTTTAIKINCSVKFKQSADA